MHSYKIDRWGASIGRGNMLLLLGLILLSPFVSWLISLLTDLLGWVLVAVGMIGIILGISYRLFGSNRVYD